MRITMSRQIGHDDMIVSSQMLRETRPRVLASGEAMDQHDSVVLARTAFVVRPSVSGTFSGLCVQLGSSPQLEIDEFINKLGEEEVDDSKRQKKRGRYCQRNQQRVKQNGLHVMNRPRHVLLCCGVHVVGGQCSGENVDDEVAENLATL